MAGGELCNEMRMDWEAKLGKYAAEEGKCTFDQLSGGNKKSSGV